MLRSQNPLLPGLLLAIGVSLLLTVAYFALSGGWTNLGNPIASIVAVVAGGIGFGAGLVPEYIRRRRAERTRQSS